MSELGKRIRNKRFRANPNADLRLRIETTTGTQFDFQITDLSLTGIGVEAAEKIPADEGLFAGAIIPSSKITFAGHEYALGRLVIRTFRQHDSKFLVGFSTVDIKVPIDGLLTKYIKQEFDSIESAFDYELSADKFSLENFSQTPDEHVDLFNKALNFEIFLKELEKTPRFSYHTIRLPSKGPRIRLAKSRKGGRDDYIIMGSNDYLGLASHPEVMQAAKDAIDEYGFGSTGSPVTTGLTVIHEELSSFISKLFGKQKTLLFNSGYSANIAILSGILQSRDLVVADFLSHASIQDGMQMARSMSRYFKHNNYEHLDKILQQTREQQAGALVVTEGIFSMDGDIAPVDEILRVARKHQCRILVDEAHSFGVIGETGLGACEKFHVLNETDMIMGTFSKICGGIGGFLATSEAVHDWLYYFGRAHMFSVSIPPSTAAAALKALQIFTRDKSLLQSVRKNISHFVRGLITLGVNLNPYHESTIVPVIIGDEVKLGIIQKVLLDAGIFVVPVTYPAVNRQSCRFRFTVMATHTVSDLDYVLTVLETAMEKAKFDPRVLSRDSDKK